VHKDLARDLGKRRKGPFLPEKKFSSPVHFVQEKECKEILVAPASMQTTVVTMRSLSYTYKPDHDVHAIFLLFKAPGFGSW
jgi:hypothetical protein